MAQLSKSWVSYYGGAGTKVTAVQYDPVNEAVYICGVTTDTSGIATAGSFKDHINSGQKSIFFARLDTTGNRVWATYFDGEADSYIPGMEVDPLGNVYICGITNSQTGIASAGALYTSNYGYQSGFIAKFDAQGQRLWSSYYNTTLPGSVGGEGHVGWRMSFDAAANVYLIASTSASQNIATAGSHQPEIDTARTPIPLPYADWPYKGDAFLAKFDSNGNRIWGTYYGGEDADFGMAVYAQPDGTVFLAGSSSGSSGGTAAIATPGAYQTTSIANNATPFLVKFDASGNRVWGTYIHGEMWAYIINIQGDGSGNIYVYGFTSSTDSIATAGTHQSAPGGSFEIFLMKFNAQGEKVWGTFYGGSDIENWVTSEAMISCTNQSLIVENGAIYLAGATNSSTGIATDCSYEPTQGPKGYIAKFDTSGQLLMGSYYDAAISDISLDTKGNIYFSSWSDFNNLATPGSYADTKPNNQNAGLFGKLKQFYVCPDSINVHISQMQNTLIADTGYQQYYWYKDGNLVSSGSSNQFNLQDTGTYYVIAETACSCQYFSDSIHTSSLGITDIVQSMQLSLIPNPAEEYIILSGKYSHNTKILRYRLMNALGAEVGSGNIFQNNGALHYKLSLAGLPKGIYLLQVLSTEGNGCLRFVKQ